MIDILKNIYLTTILVTILILSGIGIKIYTNKVKLEYQEFQRIENNQVVSDKYLVPENQYPILNVLSEILFELAFAIIVSAFILRRFEKSEREIFESKIIEIQNGTIKNAIQFSYSKLIPEEFFTIIESDIFSTSVIRRNAKWSYDFTIAADNKMKLRRCLSYTLENISNREYPEKLKANFIELRHSKMVTYEILTKGELDTDFVKRDLKQGDYYEKINPGKSADISIIMEQEFKTEFVYETHFSKYPVINLDIEITFPRNYEFTIDLDSFSTIPKKVIDTEGKRSYQINGAIYKGQGIEFYCGKKIGE